MKKYSYVIWSYEPQTTKMFDNIFKNKIFSKIIFPARIYLGNSKTDSIYLPSAKDFLPSLIPSGDISKESGRIPLYLYPENGVVFSASSEPSVNSKKPSVISIEFTINHIQDLVCTLDNLSTLLKEGISDFPIGQAYLSDDNLSEVLASDGSVSFFRPHTYKRSSRGSYRLELDWLTYFGEDYLRLLGRKRFDKLTTYSLKEEINNGILVILQKEPFDNTNLEHLARKKKAESELGFDDLINDL